MTDSPADAEGPMFERTPALGAIAAVAALVDLVFQRFVLRSLGESVPHATLVEIARWAPLARNVAAICGIVALAISLFGFVREPRVARVGHRLGLAAFAGVFMPTVVLATVLPAERTTPQVVLFASAAACVLGVLVAMTALRRPAPRGLRAGLMLVAFAAFAALLTLVLALALPPSLGEVAVITRQTVMRAGEAAFLLAPVAIGATTVLSELSPRAIVAAAAGVVTTIAATIGLAFVRAAVDGELGVLLYGAQHLEMLSDVAPAAYVAPIAIGAGIGVAALASADPAGRQAGAALLLIWAGGYAPRAPARLLMMVLGVALLARASIAIGERLVAGRSEPIKAPEPEAAREPEPEPAPPPPPST